MAEIKAHCEDCEILLGDSCLEVHEFLDQYAAYFPIRMFFEYHRSFLHNSYGLTIIEQNWGDKARKAAIIHLTRDYCGFPISHDWNWINKIFPKALMVLNELICNEPNVDPRIVKGWRGRSLVSLAMEE